jgi:glycosyltransferase involved in cell wall biosynthesis
MVLNEAMSCGVPFVATTNTGGPDLIEEGRQGFIVPIRCPEAIAEKIAYLFDHPARVREMGQEALARSAEYSWDRYGERVVGLYSRRLAARATAVST